MRKISERNCCWDEAQHNLFANVKRVQEIGAKGTLVVQTARRILTRNLLFGLKYLKILGPEAVECESLDAAMRASSTTVTGIKLLKQPYTTYRPQKML